MTLKSLVLLGILATCWFIMSGYTKPFFLVSGVLCSALTLWLTIRMHALDEASQPTHLGWRAPIYWLWLLKEMLMSSWQVAKLTLMQKPRYTPAFGWIHSEQNDHASQVTYANSITLTPGTVTVDLEDKGMRNSRLYIHALQQESLEELKAGDMHDRVQRIVNPVDAVANLAVTRTNRGTP